MVGLLPREGVMEVTLSLLHRRPRGVSSLSCFLFGDWLWYGMI